MALFGKKKPPPAAESDVEDDDEIPEVGDESTVELKKAELAPKSSKFSGWLGVVISAVAITAVAAGAGIFLGQKTATAIETSIAQRDAAAKPPEDHAISLKYSGDMVLKPLDAIVTNLASPSDVWIRLETAIVFKNGALENPEVTGAELRQDMLAYLRTVNLAQLEGPSALQHLLEDLNDRVALRTDGRVNELVIQTLVVQ